MGAQKANSYQSMMAPPQLLLRSQPQLTNMNTRVLSSHPRNRRNGGSGCPPKAAFLAAFTFLLAVAESLGQGTVHVTFDGAPPQPPGTAYTVTSYYEANISFTPIPPSYGF